MLKPARLQKAHHSLVALSPCTQQGVHLGTATLCSVARHRPLRRAEWWAKLMSLSTVPWMCRLGIWMLNNTRVHVGSPEQAGEHLRWPCTEQHGHGLVLLCEEPVWCHATGCAAWRAAIAPGLRGDNALVSVCSFRSRMAGILL